MATGEQDMIKLARVLADGLRLQSPGRVGTAMGGVYPRGLPAVDEVVGRVQDIWDHTPVQNRMFFGPIMLFGKHVQVFQTANVSKVELKYSWWHREVRMLRAVLCSAATPVKIQHVMTQKLSFAHDEYLYGERSR